MARKKSMLETLGEIVAKGLEVGEDVYGTQQLAAEVGKYQSKKEKNDGNKGKART